MPTRAPRSPNPLRWLTAERLKARKHVKHNPPACGCATPNPRQLTREEFDRRYWKVAPDTPQGAAGVPASTRREFYSDYRESGLSFAAYVKATTALQHNPKDRSLMERAMLMRERLHRMDAVADDYLRPRDERTVRGEAAHAYRLKLAAVNHELGQGMSETSEAWRAWRKEKGAPAVRNPAVGKKRAGTWARSELHRMVSHDYSAPYPAEIGKGQRVADGWVFHVTFRKAKWGKQHGFGPEFDRWYQVYAAGGASLIDAATARTLMNDTAKSRKNPFRPELVRKGGAVYGYGVWDETANDYVKRAGKPFMTDRGGMASALAKRMTARERGERPARVTVTPTRAQQIIAAARRTAVGPWSDSLNAHMSPGERAYVNAVWNRMSGSASFVSALMAIANGQVPAKGRIS